MDSFLKYFAYSILISVAVFEFLRFVSKGVFKNGRDN